VIEIPKPHHNPTHEPQPDIYLQTPTGEPVKEFEVQWEPNPYALACGDTSGLWGIIPGHYHLWASATAAALFTLARSDFRSQFYKTCPKREPSPTLKPSWSLVKEKVKNGQKRSASRCQAPEDREHSRNIKAIPTASVSPSTPSQSQEIPRENDNIHQEPGAQEPTHEDTAAPLRDDDFFYKNGNPKPPSTGRLLIRVIKRNRKRPGGRKQDRRRNKRRGSTVVDLKEITPEIPEMTNEAVEPSQFPNPARNRMLLFSFMKYAIGIQNRDNHMGPTHSPDLPIQHIVILPEKHPQKPESEIGAACFGPHTALLLQDPLNHDTYDPGKALSRPIGETG